MTVSRAHLELFLEDLDEEIESMGHVLVGHFFWILRGLRLGLTDAEMLDLSRAAYPVVCERYDLRLVWSYWPTHVRPTWPAAEGTPLEFDLDPEGSGTDPLLVLVEAAELGVSVTYSDVPT